MYVYMYMCIYICNFSSRPEKLAKLRFRRPLKPIFHIPGYTPRVIFNRRKSPLRWVDSTRNFPRTQIRRAEVVSTHCTHSRRGSQRREENPQGRGQPPGTGTKRNSAIRDEKLAELKEKGL